jgi:glucose-6-phosphate dehydrogenase assembly protein OpcA
LAAVVSTIDVAQLLEKLQEHRREVAGVLTTTLNVIAFVEDDPRLLEHLSNRITVLSERHPSRTILLSCDQTAAEVHGEHVHIAAGGLSAEELQRVVHHLLVPDVHTVLLWAGETLGDARLPALGALAETVVLFGTASGAGPKALRELLALEGSGLEHKTRDLGFLRLLAWQETIAFLFDDPDLAAELPAIVRVEIEAGSGTEALYLLGWLASRLNWEPCGENEFCNARGQTVAAELRRTGLPRRIYSVRMRSANCDFGLAVDLENEDLVCLTVEGRKQRVPQCTALRDVDMIALIERAVFMKTHPPVYVETLQMVRRLLQLRA